MKVYIVLELTKEMPKILSVNKTKREAEKIAYADKTKYCNIIEKELGNNYVYFKYFKKL